MNFQVRKACDGVVKIEEIKTTVQNTSGFQDTEERVRRWTDGEDRRKNGPK